MSALVTIPANFSELFKKLFGKEIGISCTQGQKIYCGILHDVYPKGIILQVKGFYRNLPFNTISSLTLSAADNYSPESTFPHISTKLFQKYQKFLNKKVTIVRKDNNAWNENGEIKYIGEDYFVILNHDDNVLIYVNTEVDFEIIISP